MAQHTEKKQGIATTVGLDTDAEGRIVMENFLLDAPRTTFCLFLENSSDRPIKYIFPSKLKACFSILREDGKLLWAYHRHTAHKKRGFILEPGETYDRINRWGYYWVGL